MDKLTTQQEELILNNINLVHYILQKKFYIFNTDERYEDMYSEGLLGLILAAKRFDPDKGFKFATFATQYIFGYISDYKNKYLNSKSFKVPASILRSIPHVLRLQLENKSDDEIKKELNLSDIVYNDIINLLKHDLVGSLNKTLNNFSNNEDNDKELYSIISNIRNDIEEFIDEDYVDYLINYVANHLNSDKHKGLWYEYVYTKLLSDDKIIQKDLGDKYGLSQSYVARLLRKCKKLLITEISKNIS